ncbi:hypothetical protein Ancab_009831, partial [Ancistrocladus abbreviatus]
LQSSKFTLSEPWAADPSASSWLIGVIMSMRAMSKLLFFSVNSSTQMQVPQELATLVKKEVSQTYKGTLKHRIHTSLSKLSSEKLQGLISTTQLVRWNASSVSMVWSDLAFREDRSTRSPPYVVQCIVEIHLSLVFVVREEWPPHPVLDSHKLP